MPCSQSTFWERIGKFDSAAIGRQENASMTGLMTKLMVSLALAAVFQQMDAETRIINYLKANVKPGQPVRITELVNNVFKTPEERQVLDRLFNTFFKVPITVAQFYTKSNKIPTLQQLSDQF